MTQQQQEEQEIQAVDDKRISTVLSTTLEASNSNSQKDKDDNNHVDDNDVDFCFHEIFAEEEENNDDCWVEVYVASNIEPRNCGKLVKVLDYEIPLSSPASGVPVESPSSMSVVISTIEERNKETTTPAATASSETSKIARKKSSEMKGKNKILDSFSDFSAYIDLSHLRRVRRSNIIATSSENCTNYNSSSTSNLLDDKSSSKSNSNHDEKDKNKHSNNCNNSKRCSIDISNTNCSNSSDITSTSKRHKSTTDNLSTVSTLKDRITTIERQQEQQMQHKQRQQKKDQTSKQPILLEILLGSVQFLDQKQQRQPTRLDGVGQQTQNSGKDHNSDRNLYSNGDGDYGDGKEHQYECGEKNGNGKTEGTSWEKNSSSNGDSECTSSILELFKRDYGELIQTPNCCIKKVLVPNRLANSEEEHGIFQSKWPIKYFPNKMREYHKKDLVLSQFDIEQMKKGMKYAIEDSYENAKTFHTDNHSCNHNESNIMTSNGAKATNITQKQQQQQGQQPSPQNQQRLPSDSLKLKRRLPSTWPGAIILNPITSQCVSKANDERKQQHGIRTDYSTMKTNDISKETGQLHAQKNISLSKQSITNPLSTSLLLAIQGVSRIERQGAITQGSMETPEFQNGQYLCTNLDLYMTSEPTVFESMALVHSRIRRVIFFSNHASGTTSGSGNGSDNNKLPSLSRSLPPTLGSGILKMKIHSLPGTNHHFRAFMCSVSESGTNLAKEQK